MDETYSAQVIILDNHPFRESDSRIIAYSLEHGQLELVVRGTKKILSKLAGHIEPISLVQIMVVKGRQFDYAGSATGEKSYVSIRNDLEKLAAVGIAFKAFNKIVKPGVADARLFFLLKDYLEFLEGYNKRNELELFAYYFIFKLLAELGFRPALHNCIVCSKKIEPKSNYFSAALGGVICGPCRSKEETRGLTISENAIKILRLVNEKQFSELAKIKTDKRLEKELINIINSFYQYHF